MTDSPLVYKLILSFSRIEDKNITLALLDSYLINGLEETDHSLCIYSDDKSFLENVWDRLESSPYAHVDLISLEEIQNQNWNQQWEASFQPIEIDNYCKIRASFHKPGPEFVHDIIINPKMAFGTGHHETTHLMIDQMRHMKFKGKRILDFGCGTAILSILSEKLGAREVLGIDNDPMAIDCARQCLLLNHSNSVELKIAEISDLQRTPYDTILANINRNVLLNSTDTIHKLIVKKGELLLSGILEKDKYHLINRYEKCGFRLVRSILKNEWICLYFLKI